MRGQPDESMTSGIPDKLKALVTPPAWWIIAEVFGGTLEMAVYFHRLEYVMA